VTGTYVSSFEAESEVAGRLIELARGVGEKSSVGSRGTSALSRVVELVETEPSLF